MQNFLSKTHFEVTKDRLQHYSNEQYECSECGHHYHPKVHSQPYIIQFGIILIGVPAILLIIYKAIIWLFVFGALSSIYFYFYLKKERKVAAGEAKYGDIVLECPKCGSKNGTPAR